MGHKYPANRLSPGTAAKLVGQITAGNQEAANELYRRKRRAIRLFSRKNRIPETRIVEQLFHQIQNQRAAPSQLTSVSLAVNQIKDPRGKAEISRIQRREKRRRAEAHHGRIRNRIQTPEQIASQREVREKIEKLVRSYFQRQMPKTAERNTEFFILRFLEGNTCQRIGDSVDLSKEMVSRITNNALTNLRENSRFQMLISELVNSGAHDG